MMRTDRYLRLCFGEALRGLVGRRRAAASSVMIIALSLVVLGGFLLVSDNLNGLLHRWRERGHVQVFLEPGFTVSQQQAAADAIRESPEIDSFRFLSADQAAAQFREDFQQLGDLLAFLEENPLPASFVITVRENFRNEGALLSLAERWEAMPGVDAAQYDLEVIRRLELGVNGLRFVGAVLGGAVLIAAIITTANVIRVLVVARRREIIVLRLVGATESVVRGRFLAEGAIQGFLGGLFALVVLYVICRIGVSFVTVGGSPLLSLVELQFFNVFLFAQLIGLGVAAGLIGALLAFGAADSLEQ